MSIRTTHVGSLPHTSLLEALDYTFKFDLPVLPSLPNLNTNDFLGKDITTKLEIGEYTQDHKVFLNPSFYKCKKQFHPSFQEDFLRRMEFEKVSSFKYQLIGPITYLKMLANPANDGHIFSFFLDKYIHLVNHLRSYGLELFILDEPLLSKSSVDLLRELNKFIEILGKETGVEIGIHFCCKLDEILLGQILDNLLHFDISLFMSNNCRAFHQINFAGFKDGVFKLQDFDGNFTTKFQHLRLIAPECGLFFKTKDELNHIINNLNLSKESLLDSYTWLK